MASAVPEVLAPESVAQLGQTIKEEAGAVTAALRKASKDWSECSNNAYVSLAKLTKAEFTEVKSLGKPPEFVQIVMKAVMVCLGEKDDGWKNIQKAMGNPDGFVEKLKNFNPSKVDNKMLEKLAPLVNCEGGFTTDRAKKASRAAAGCAEWVLAVWEFGNDQAI